MEELNAREKEENQEIILHCSPLKQNAMDEQHSCNGGYLFLQQIYYQLGIDKICREIADRHSFAFDLNSILSRLVYARIIFPASKLGTMELSNRFLEPPHFELQHIYRALEVVAKENDLIQSEIYKNSLRIADRNCGILYYDCTNYFFEIEQTDGIRQYGVSKEHRPSPIVQMGLFMPGIFFGIGRFYGIIIKRFHIKDFVKSLFGIVAFPFYDQITVQIPQIKKDIHRQECLLVVPVKLRETGPHLSAVRHV